MVGLDPRSAKLLKEILKEQISNGVTIFLSTHTLSVAQELCTRIGIIMNGKLIITGTYDELKKKSSEKAGEVHNLEEIFLKLTEEEE
jgi:ABC-2 type transport system ATP-binding protein